MLVFNKVPANFALTAASLLCEGCFGNGSVEAGTPVASLEEEPSGADAWSGELSSVSVEYSLSRASGVPVVFTAEISEAVLTTTVSVE